MNDDERASYDPYGASGAPDLEDAGHVDDRGLHAASGLFAPHPDDLYAGGLHADDVHPDGLYGEGLHPDDVHPDDARWGRDPADHPSGPLPVAATHHGHRRARRLRARRRTVAALAIVVVVALGVGAWVLSGRLFAGSGGTDDYTGTGTGRATVTVRTGDGAAQIGRTLAAAGVVATAAAFVDAANADTASRTIQPGVYALRTQMSAKAALAALLAPTSRLTKKLTIPEGTIAPVVLQGLADALGVPLAQVQQAAGQVDQLGLPATYTTPTAPTSVEGFLFPATYEFDPGTTPRQALQTIVAQFVANDRKVGLSEQAASLGLSPYQVLTMASIAQAEIKFPEDGSKVARVILNRIAQGRPLQVDPTSAYAAKIAGQDPTAVDYATIDSPYNTYTHPGLPPTPIDSPGAQLLAEAAAPAPGNWLYYVNGDAAGHLFFTADEAAFLQAAQNCAAQHWGCASQTGG